MGEDRGFFSVKQNLLLKYHHPKFLFNDAKKEKTLDWKYSFLREGYISTLGGVNSDKKYPNKEGWNIFLNPSRYITSPSHFQSVLRVPYRLRNGKSMVEEEVA